MPEDLTQHLVSVAGAAVAINRRWSSQGPRFVTSERVRPNPTALGPRAGAYGLERKAQAFLWGGAPRQSTRFHTLGPHAHRDPRGAERDIAILVLPLCVTAFCAFVMSMVNLEDADNDRCCRLTTILSPYRAALFP